MGGLDRPKTAGEEVDRYLRLLTNILHCILSRLHSCVFVDHGTCSRHSSNVHSMPGSQGLEHRA
jgi:hypothetical protein